MSLNLLKNFKKKEKNEINTKEVDILSVGPSVNWPKFHQIWENEGKSFYHLATEEEEHYLSWMDSLSPIRGQDNCLALQNLGLNFIGHEEGALFYKDQKFRSFGGRSKSFPLKEGEDYFLRPGAKLGNDFFPPRTHPPRMDMTSFLSLKSLVKEDQGWKCVLSNGDVVLAKNIYFSGDLQTLLNTWRNVWELVSEPLLKEINSQQRIQDHRKILLVHWWHPEEVCNLRNTLYIPQSQTHEWGHFIGEFSPYVEGEGQKFCFFSFIEESELEAEELTRKFQNMKRSLARVFSQWEQDFQAEAHLSRLKESVTLMEDFTRLPCVLDLRPGFVELGLHWVGPFAPFGQDEKLKLKEFQGQLSMIDGLVRDLFFSPYVKQIPLSETEVKISENIFC